MAPTLAVFIPIALFICVTLCVYFISRFRYGAIIKLGGPIPKSPHVRRSWKKIGIVVIGFAFGTLITGLLFEWNYIGMDTDWTGFFIVGIISLCVGISLFVADKFEDKDEKIDG